MGVRPNLQKGAKTPINGTALLKKCLQLRKEQASSLPEFMRHALEVAEEKNETEIATFLAAHLSHHATPRIKSDGIEILFVH